jgi:hypothetical protein
MPKSINQKLREASTQNLWDAIEAGGVPKRRTESHSGPVFPADFLMGVRQCLEAGMTSDQITSFLLMISGLYDALQLFDGEELMERSMCIIEVMKGDMEWNEGQIAFKERVKLVHRKRRKKVRL